MKPIIEYNHHNSGDRRGGIETLLGLSRDEANRLIPILAPAPSSRVLVKCILEYVRNGAQVFCIGPEMQNMLQDTSLDGVRVEEFQLPYPAFYVATPQSSLKIWGGPTRWHAVEGAYILETREFGGHCLTIYIWGAENKLSKGIGDDATFYINIDMVSAKRYPSMDAYLENLMKSAWADTEASGPPNPTRNLENIREYLRVIFNMLVYIDSVNVQRDERQVRSKRRKKLERKRNKTRQTNAIDRQLRAEPIMTVVTLGRAVENAEAVGPIDDPDFISSPRQHRVKAHWRRYWYGKKGERVAKRLRIETFMRGDHSKGVVMGREYHVEETPKE